MTTIDSKALEAVADILWRNIHGDVKWLDYEERHYIKVAEAAITAYLAALPSPKVEGEPWRYSINYGPDGEENWANVYDGKGVLVGNLRVYHATQIVALANAAPSPILADEGVAGLVEQAFHEGWVSSFGTDKHRPERAWEFSSARRTLQSRKSPPAVTP